jgi:hypothetical protein
MERVYTINTSKKQYPVQLLKDGSSDLIRERLPIPLHTPLDTISAFSNLNNLDEVVFEGTQAFIAIHYPLEGTLLKGLREYHKLTRGLLVWSIINTVIQVYEESEKEDHSFPDWCSHIGVVKEEGSLCSVCIEDISPVPSKVYSGYVNRDTCFGDKAMYSSRVLRCSHAFHFECIAQWLDKSSNTCPVCRDDVECSECVKSSFQGKYGIKTPIEGLHLHYIHYTGGCFYTYINNKQEPHISYAEFSRSIPSRFVGTLT